MSSYFFNPVRPVCAAPVPAKNGKIWGIVIFIRMGKNRPFWPRWALLAAVAGAAAWLAFGRGERSFEAFCPFGGAEALWGLFREGEFSCTLGPLNLAMLAAVLALAALAKKAFCGWLCPVGFLGELLAKAGTFLRRGRPLVPPAADAKLELLRYAALALALFFTYKTGELVLRGFDPYFLLFSGFGHGSMGKISAAVLALTALGALLVPMFFCRYLCPLGALMDPLSRFAPARLRRDESKCTSCGLCARACPHSLPVDKAAEMKHADCTNCLDCAAACPEAGALRFGLFGLSPRPARLVPAALALLALFGGYNLRAAFTRPTTSDDFGARPGAKVTFTVEGLRCKGTASYLASLFENEPGVASVVTYAAEHKAVFAYDPALTSPEKLKAVIERPVKDDEGNSEEFYKVTATE